MSKKKYRYRLRAGRHTEGGYINDKGKHVSGPVYKKGDVFETDTDFVKLFGRSANSKFEPVGQTAAVMSEPPPEEEQEEFVPEVDDAAEEDEDSDGLEEMTVAALREHANNLGIDLGNAKKKADIVSEIREALAADEE